MTTTLIRVAGKSVDVVDGEFGVKKQFVVPRSFSPQWTVDWMLPVPRRLSPDWRPIDDAIETMTFAQLER